MKINHYIFLESLFWLLIFFAPAISHITKVSDATASAQKVPKVFLDCDFCDFDFIRSEIPFVNYVYDRANADIHILITRQHTGSEGREFTLTFIGRGVFSSLRDTLSVTTLHEETDDEVRRKLTHAIEIGLIPYIYNTEIMKNLSINYEGTRDTIVTHDKWKLWFFRINFSGFFNGEASTTSHSFSNRFYADRITDQWKIRFSSRLSYEKDSYEIDEEMLTSSESNKQLNLLIVKSISDHWSIGINSRFYSNTYDNISSAFNFSPGIEYNIFPYSQYTIKVFRFLYDIGYEYNHYYKETIYNKTTDKFLQQSMEIAYETKNPWGRIDIFLRGSHYFHDLTKNHLSIYSELSLRLFKGFSFYLEGGYSRIRDQLALPKSNATIDEILLQRRELETQYSYWGEVGLEFSFGSIYNNIVNPRFGD